MRESYLAFGTPSFSDAEIEAITRVMRSGWVGMGPETLAFETELASFLGASQVVTVNSCTSALFLALRELGIGRGDEVIVPSLTWCATINAVLYLGATPVFCDIEPNGLLSDIEVIQSLITPHTRAVLPVHFGGLALDVATLRTQLPENVAIVEDAAHALGSCYPDGTLVGSSGNLTCFSFYANKNLSTGEGGAIALADPERAEHLRSLRQNALLSNAWNRYITPQSAFAPDIQELGYKMNYTDLQAAIGRVQLRRQQYFAEERQKLAELYVELLADRVPDVRPQAGVLSSKHAKHLFVVCLPEGANRDAILKEMRRRNLGVSIHYPPLHRMPLYASQVRRPMTNTEALAPTLLTLPIGQSVTLEDGRMVVENLAELLETLR